MDKGKSKTDLRAAGKKRLEEFRQKRQQKGGSATKATSTTALKALSESEQNSGENAVEEISRRDSLVKEEAQRPLPAIDGDNESVVDHEHEAAKASEEEHRADFDTSPASSVTSSIQRVKVGGHLAPESAEQSVESPCEPGSSNGNLEDKDREAVYTILWESHGTEHSHRNEEWQESSFDSGASRNERGPDQGIYSSFRVDDNNFGSESKECLSTPRKLSGNSNDAVDKFQASEVIKEWDEHSLSLVPIPQRPEAEGGRKDVLPVDPGSNEYSPFSNDDGTEDRALVPEANEKLEKEKAGMKSELAMMVQKVEHMLEESDRARESHENEINLLKFQVREKDDAVSARDAQLEELVVSHENEINFFKIQVRGKDEVVSARDAQLEELAVAKAQSEQSLRTTLDRADKEKEQLLQECMDVKSQVGKLAEERDKFMSSIVVYEKDLEMLRTDSANMTMQLNNLSGEKNHLTTELRAAKEQAVTALEHEAQLRGDLRELEEERERERMRLQNLEAQVEDIRSQKVQVEVRCGESANALEELRVVSKQLSDELAVSEQERNISRDRIKTLEGEQLRLHDLVENLTHQLGVYEEKEAESKALYLQVKDSEDECKRLQLVVANLESDLHSLEVDKVDISSKFRDLQVEKERLITEVVIAKNELKVAQSQLELSRTEELERVEELTSVKYELTKTLADKLKIQLDEEESRWKLEQLRVQFGKLEIERSQIEEYLGQKLQLLEENVRVLEEQKIELEELLAGAKRDLEQLNEQVRKIDAEKAVLKVTSAIAVEALEQQVRLLGGERSELEERCQNLRAELQLLSEKLNTLVAEKLGMEATAEMLQRKATDLEYHNSELDQRSSVLSEEKNRLSNELAISQRALETIQAEKVQLESDLRLLQEELLTIKEEKEHLRSELEIYQEKLNVITSEKEFVANQLKESHESLQLVSEESKSVAFELSATLKRFDESTELNKKLGGDLKSLEEELHGAEEVRARVEFELEASLSKLNDSIQENDLLSNKRDCLFRSVEALEKEKVEFGIHVQELRETVNRKDKEIIKLKGESMTEISNLKAQLERPLQLDDASDESHPSISAKDMENMSVEDFESVSPRSHAANVKLVKKLVEVFEGKVSDDVQFQNHRDIASPVTQFLMQAQAMKKASDDLQRDRDTAMLAETTLRADFDLLTNRFRDVGEERINLQAVVTELQDKLAVVTADCSHLYQIIEDLRNGDGEGVKMVAVLEEDKIALQGQILELAEKLRVAEESLLSMLEGQAELVAKVHMLEEERDSTRADLQVMTECNNDLQVEKIALISEKEVSKSEVEVKLTNETEARAVYEGQIKALTSSLAEADNQLKSIKNECTDLERKLLEVVNREYPDRELKPSGAVEGTLDFCWFLTTLIFEGNSRKLEDLHTTFSQEKSELNAIIAEERLQHQAGVVNVEADREVFQQEKDVLSGKVKSLENELALLQEEQKRVSHEYQALLEVEAKAQVDMQEKIQKLESTVDDLQRGSEEREAKEAEVRSVHEKDIALLNSRVQSIQSELDKVRDLHIRFDEKLESAAHDVLPVIEVKPVNFEDILFDYSWAIVSLILEEYSRRLQHAHADLMELESKVNSGKEEEIRVLQELVQRITEELAAAKEERNEVSEKVRVLEEERMQLQEEQERVAQELELEAKAKVRRQEKIQMLEDAVDDLQRDLEEREAREAEARSEHEKDTELLDSKLQSIQSELDKVRDLHVRFDEKLESAAREVLPVIEFSPVDFEDNLFDYSWSIVNLILEEYSRRLQHADADMIKLESKVSSGKEEEIRGLQELVQRLTDELATLKDEKVAAQSELVQSEKRYTSTKERLTLAINKGKSIVVQRDAVKASLAEKTAELERVASEHKEMIQSKDIALQEAEARASALKVRAEEADALEEQLVEARNTSDELRESLTVTRSALTDMEIAVDKITPHTDHTSETRVGKLEWLAATLKDLQMRLNYYESKAESLVMDLTGVSNEKEVVSQKLQDVSLKCEQLEKLIVEDASNIAAHRSEIENLQEMILAMEAEAEQHIKTQHVVSMAIKLLYSSGQDSEVDPTLSSFSKSDLGAAVNFHLNKHASVVHESDELREQSNEHRTVIENLEEEKAVAVENLQSLQEILQARNVELRDAKTKLERASGVISENEEEIEAKMKQIETLNDELIKCNQNFGLLNSSFNMAEKEIIGLKEELYGAVGSFKSIPKERSPHVEGVTLTEVVMEVNSLVKTIVEQAHTREMELETANEKAMAALFLESDTNKERLAELQQEFLDSRNAAQGISWLHGPSPPSSSLLDWATWLIDALQEEHRKLEQASQEIESMAKTADERRLQVQSLQEKSDVLSIELSNLQNEKAAVAEELNTEDLDLQMLKGKLQELEKVNLALESEVESVRAMSHLQYDWMEIEGITKDFHLQGRPSPTSSPSEWCSWLIQIIRKVSEDLNTSKNIASVFSLQAEEAELKYANLYEELSSQKDDNKTLQDNLREVSETFKVEIDALKAEIQVLRDSSMEMSNLEYDLSEAQSALSDLKDTLAVKDRELSDLFEEIEELSLKYARQDSKLQSLMEERERLSSEVVEVRAERSQLQTQLAEAANEKSSLQSEVSQHGQKLVALREKLYAAINKGKGLEKLRDTLKQSVAEKTAKIESMVSLHAKEMQAKDSELLKTRAQAEAMGSRVQELQAEVSSLHKIATTSQQRLQTERQSLETTLSGIEISNNVVSRDPIEKVKWLVLLLQESRNATKYLEEELDISRNSLETVEALLKETEESLLAETLKTSRAEEAISLYVKKVEDAESTALVDRSQYESEMDGMTRVLKEAEMRQQVAVNRVKELEKALEKQQNAVNASEAARSKTVSKLTFTRNKLNLLVQDSQELVKECESLHKSLQERNAEVAELRNEVDRLKNNIHDMQSQNLDAGSESSLQITLLQEELARTNEKSAATVQELRDVQMALQSVLKEKTSDLEGVRRKIDDILLKGDNVLWMDQNIINQNKGDGSLGELDVQSVNGNQDLASVTTRLEQRFDTLIAGLQTYRSTSDKKEAQIQKLKKDIQDVLTEKTALQAGVQAKAMEVERLRSEINTKAVLVEDSSSAPAIIEELGTRSTYTATPHVRGPRRHSQADIVIDMDDEGNASLLSDMNGKEHGFSALTNSRLVPKATRILADRLDGLWFAGGRVLTRQPSARLGLAIYWIFLHIYMLMSFSRGFP